MFRYLSCIGGITSRCKFTTLLLMVFAVFAFSSVAQAQDHGIGIGKSCSGPVRTCDSDLDCDDGDACTFEECDLTIPDTLSCTFTASYNDGFDDTISILQAWDTVDPFGTPTRSPGSGNAEIVNVGGNTTCVIGGTLPCTIGPAAGAGAGFVTFAENLYEPTSSDPNPLPDQITVAVMDMCNGTFYDQCDDTITNFVSFSAQTNLVDGCVDLGDEDCDDGAVCTNEH